MGEVRYEVTIKPRGRGRYMWMVQGTFPTLGEAEAEAARIDRRGKHRTAVIRVEANGDRVLHPDA